MPCKIYQLAPQTHTQMMGYVIKTPGDSLIVIDGGTAGDADYLLYLLRRLGGNRPQVKAWFLTHPHSDHVYALYDLLQNRPEAFSLDALYLHYPERRVLEIGEPRSLPAWDGYQALRSQIGSREHILREGEHLDIDGTAWDVLYTSDPAFTRNASNNSSCVLRMTSEGVRTLFLGDLGVEGGEKLLRMHGDALQSDIVQMGHHGQSAVRMDVYHAIRPQVCLWCAPKWLWDNNQGRRGYDSGVWDILRVREEMRRLGVRRHAIAKDGTYRITLDGGNIDIFCADPFAAQ